METPVTATVVGFVGVVGVTEGGSVLPPVLLPVVLPPSSPKRSQDAIAHTIIAATKIIPNSFLKLLIKTPYILILLRIIYT